MITVFSDKNAVVTQLMPKIAFKYLTVIIIINLIQMKLCWLKLQYKTILCIFMTAGKSFII